MISSNEIYLNIIYPEEEFTNESLNSSSLINSEITSNNPIYGNDLSFSNFNNVADENSIVQNVFNILLTRPGERLNNPEFGCRVHDLIFSLYETEDAFSDEVINAVNEALQAFETRAILNTEQSFVILNGSHAFDVVLYIQIPTGIVKVVKATIKSVEQ
jgi:phage baseplate assembly protein W